MEQWQNSFQEQQKELNELREIILEKQKNAKLKKGDHKAYQIRLEKIEELTEIAEKLDKLKGKELTKGKEQLLKLLEQTKLNGTSFNLNNKINFNINSGDDNIFFLSNGGKNLKIKKTIKIKMPKKAKLKLNVRHGEVTLASTSENIHAKLSAPICTPGAFCRSRAADPRPPPRPPAPRAPWCR